MRLLEDARRAGHEEVGFDDGHVVDDLLDASVDGSREADLQTGGDQHLAEDVREGQPQELEVVLGQGSHRLDDGSLVDDAVLDEPHPLGPPGRAGGVDDDGEALGARAPVDARLDEVRGLGQPLAPLGGELVDDDDPAVLAALAGERDDVLHPGDLTAHALQLGDLVGVLGEDELAARVGEDVGDVLGDRRRVDGRRRATGADDREVGEHPLDPRRGGDRDAVLELHPECDEARGPLLDDLVGVAPGEGRELGRLPLEVEVCRCVRCRLHPTAEERSDTRGALVEDRLVDGSVGEGDQGHADSFVAASPVIGVCGRRSCPDDAKRRGRPSPLPHRKTPQRDP